MACPAQLLDLCLTIHVSLLFPLNYKQDNFFFFFFFYEKKLPQNIHNL